MDSWDNWLTVQGVEVAATSGEEDCLENRDLTMRRRSRQHQQLRSYAGERSSTKNYRRKSAITNRTTPAVYTAPDRTKVTSSSMAQDDVLMMRKDRRRRHTLESPHSLRSKPPTMTPRSRSCESRDQQAAEAAAAVATMQPKQSLLLQGPMHRRSDLAAFLWQRPYFVRMLGETQQLQKAALNVCKTSSSKDLVKTQATQPAQPQQVNKTSRRKSVVNRFLTRLQRNVGTAA